MPSEFGAIYHGDSVRVSDWQLGEHQFAQVFFEQVFELTQVTIGRKSAFDDTAFPVHAMPLHKFPKGFDLDHHPVEFLLRGLADLGRRSG